MADETKLTPEIFTSLVEEYGLHAAIEKAEQNYKPEYPKSPDKPYLSKTHTHKEVVQYSALLEAYEMDVHKHKKDMDRYKRRIKDITDIIQEGIKNQLNFYDAVPEIYQSKLWWKAVEMSDGDGKIGLYEKLRSLMEIFE